MGLDSPEPPFLSDNATDGNRDVGSCSRDGKKSASTAKNERLTMIHPTIIGRVIDAQID